MLFSSFRSLEIRTSEEGNKSVKSTVTIIQFVIFPVALTCIYLYGTNLGSDLFERNIGAGNKDWPTFVMRIAFLLVTLAHVPFIFFAAKECFLSLVDELHRRQ